MAAATESIQRISVGMRVWKIRLAQSAQNMGLGGVILFFLLLGEL
jgi:hypothetical protein